MTDTLEVYRDPRGGAWPAGKATPCWAAFVGGRWFELYDPDGESPVLAIPYGPSANRDALGELMQPHELPPRIAGKVAELEARR